MKRKNIIVFASGGGSNFKNILKKISSENLPINLCLLVSNNINCGAVKYAKKNDIDFFIYNKLNFPNDDEQKILYKKIKSKSPDLIILAGYLKKISKQIVKSYNKKILNIHPSLLPKYGGKGNYGMNVHNKVYQNKDNISGATIHFVDYNYDTGPILIQKSVLLDKFDNPKTIAEKVLKIEHEIYPKAIKYFCYNQISWDKNIPKIKE